MEVNYSRKEKIVGAFVTVVAVLLVGVLIMVGRGKQWFKNFVPYYSTFDESYNLQEGSAVKMFKAEIGKVKKISILEDRVKIEMIVLEQFTPRIRVGSKVAVESVTFIGSEYLSIIPGPKDAPLVPRGGLIPSVAKKSLTDIMEEFQVEKTAKMLVQAVQNLSELTYQMKQPDGPLFRILHTVEKTVANIEAITGNLNAGEGTVGALLTSNELLKDIRNNLDKVGRILDHVLKASARAPGEMDRVGNILTHFERASSKLPATVTGAQDSLKAFKRAGDEMSDSVIRIRDLVGEIEKNLKSFQIILDNIKKGSFEIPKITRSSREGIQEARQGIEELDKVVKSLQKNILIRKNIPPDPAGKTTDAGLRK